jgi:hypothetical protein
MRCVGKFDLTCDQYKNALPPYVARPISSPGAADGSTAATPATAAKNSSPARAAAWALMAAAASVAALVL